MLAGSTMAQGVTKASGDTVTVTVPTADVIHTFRTSDEGMPKSFTIGRGFQVIGDYLYLSTGGDRTGGGTIQYFKWDPQAVSNKIVYGGFVTNSTLTVGLTLCAAGGRLYGQGVFEWGAKDSEDNSKCLGLTWYDIEEGTGRPVEKGVLSDIKTDWSMEHLIADPDAKSLYVFAREGKLTWLKIGADGTPAKAGEVTGPGVGSNPRMSPDGKNVYSIRDHKIGIVARKPGGEITYQSALSLNCLVTNKAPGVGEMGDLRPAIAGLSPDGQWLYVQIFSEQSRTRCFFGIFKRDPATGALAFQEGGSDYDAAYNKFATLPGMNLIFAADGKGGYITTGGDLVQRFRYDASTGHLADISDVITPVDKFRPGSMVVYDSKRNLMFGTGVWQYWAYGSCWRGFWVAKTGSAQVRSGGRLDIKATRAAADAKVTSTDDWPCWRGSTGDGKSPLKGIRKDWTGGLKEVWRVSGLSPVPSSWSAPSVKGDKLVILGKHGFLDEVFCFDADKGGAPVWVTELPGSNGWDGWGGGPTATPYIDGDKVYLSQSDRYVCLSMLDGRVIWKRDGFSGGHAPGHSPLVWQDLAILPNVVVPTTNHPSVKRVQLAALKKDTGEQVWGYQEDSKRNSEGYESPLILKINGKEQVVYSTMGYACGLDPRTGKPVWEHEPTNATADIICHAPMTDGSTVVVATGYRAHKYVKMDHRSHPGGLTIENGAAKVLWDGDYQALWGDGILQNGYIYTFSADGLYSSGNSTFRCVDFKTGTSKWVQEKTGCGTLVEVDGALICLTYTGDLWLVEPSPDGFKKITEWNNPIPSELWSVCQAQAKTPMPFWTVPVVARGKLYVRYSDVMICYDLMK